MNSLDHLKRYTVARNFPKATTLKRVLERLGYLQADPIRAPARAQDLILRQRVKDYHAGDIERLYSKLDIEEDFFVNYGYVTRKLHSLMHPRSNSVIGDDIGDPWRPVGKQKEAELVLAFVKERGTVHPKEVHDFFSHGKVTNYWGGSSNLTTHLLEAMHYLGMVRVTRREKGIRLYSAREIGTNNINDQHARLDALADVVINLYAPFPAASLPYYLRRLRYATPQWVADVPTVIQRTKDRLTRARIDGIDWFWDSTDNKTIPEVEERVRLLAPFDPLVHDRRRFELLWGWEYRFEAYTPAAKRKLGYYAMPMLWRNDVIGWANLSVKDNELAADIGYMNSAPRSRNFKRELDAELERMRNFLNLTK